MRYASHGDTFCPVAEAGRMELPKRLRTNARHICLGVAYAARKAAVDAKVAFRKYSAGARMAGAWGYYAPSDVWLHAYTGREKGMPGRRAGRQLVFLYL